MEQREIFIRAASDNNEKLSELLQKRQIYLDTPCGGKGNCGRCRVQFIEGAPEATEQEQIILTVQEQECGIRLACQTIPKEPCRVLLPESMAEEMVVVSDGMAGKREANDEEANACGMIDVRDRSGSVGKPGNVHARGTAACGIAVDIGTTTLVMALYDLASGRRLGAKTSVNHQRAYGADVLARIAAANRGQGSLLQKTIQNDLRRLLISLLHQCGVLPAQIERMVIAGNTTMCHLLLGYSVETLGSAPFTPVNIGWITLSYEEVFAGRETAAQVIVMPGISAFVGADIVAGIYASGMTERNETCLFLDVGTNGEMAVGNRGGISVTSTAAGPVFEGGGIANGMPGVPGAVSHLSLTAQGETDLVQTIGDKPPIGLCGSGIVDFVGELVRNRLVDENGTLQEPWFSQGIPKQEPRLRLYQNDIREFQMGKAAIRAGIDLLLSSLQTTGGVPEKIYLAGGFGYGLSVESAVKTGMFPADFAGRVEALGNSALAGAARYLLLEEKDKVDRIVELAQSINLAEEPDFYGRYVDAMQFEGKKPSLPDYCRSEE